MHYAGFWRRFVAYILDTIPLGIISLVLAMMSGQDLLDPDAASSFGISDFIGLFLSIAYFVGFETSSWQATPGKRALGMIVVDATGGRISVGQAVGRYFAKILSGLVMLLGFIMIAFTDRKQGLHDLLAKTLVLVAEPGSTGYDASVFE